MSSDEEPTFLYSSDDDITGAAKATFLEELEQDSKQTQQKNYTVLTESDIRQQIENTIEELCSVLFVSKHEASTLLRHYNWSCSKVHDAWFADEASVRKNVGLLDDQNVRNIERSSYDCGICFESYSHEFIKFMACGHSFCCECWSSYIRTSVNDGPGCLSLRCPELSCVVAVPDDMINELASEEDKKKYSRFLARSYVENNKKRKWCPAPGCEFAIDFVAGDENFDVLCKCSHNFCWNCGEEKHRPVECRTVEKWMKKNSSEYENETWKKAYTKPCPKCNRDIEKNKGCMHMSCPKPCGFQFCWICLQDWLSHGYNGPCNRYEATFESKETQTLKQDLRKYQHYYERWAANEKSKQIAMNDLKNVEHKLVDQIRLIQCQSLSEVDFLTEAWQQIVECRQVLKWTYAYGYYLPEKEHAKKQLFEYVQGEAESGLERLHDFAEGQVKKFSVPGTPSIGEFGLFRRTLIELTKATKTYFDNLVRALETGLSDVTSKGHRDSDGASTSVAKKSRGGRVRSTITATSPITYIATLNTDGRPWPPLPLPPPGRPRPEPEPQAPWTCEFCSYNNPEYAMTCEVCLRGSWTCPFCTYANPRTQPLCQMCNEPR